MNLLALDASTEYLSLAIMHGAQQWSFHEATGPAASQRILPEIQRLLCAANLRLQDLDGIVYGMGPGAFTGVRVAVGVAQGLAFATRLPVLGISSVEAVAEAVWQATGANQVIVCLDARMGEVYHAALVRQGAAWLAILPPTVCKPEAVPTLPVDKTAGDWVAAGSGWRVFEAALWPHYAACVRAVYAEIAPQATAMLALAPALFTQGRVQAAQDAAPLYVRNRVALTAAERAQGQLL